MTHTEESLMALADECANKYGDDDSKPWVKVREYLRLAICEVLTERDELRKDAERYRHIRQFEITAYWKDGDCAYSEDDPAELDAAIDSALANEIKP
jgi:hypothetical protein